MEKKFFRHYLDILDEIESPDESPKSATIPDSNFSQQYLDWAKDNPKLKLALDVLPGSAQTTSVADTLAYLDQKKYGDAALAALGVIPGVKPISRLLSKLPADAINRQHQLAKATKTADYVDRAIDTTQNVSQDIANRQANQPAAELSRLQKNSGIK